MRGRAKFQAGWMYFVYLTERCGGSPALPSGIGDLRSPLLRMPPKIYEAKEHRSMPGIPVDEIWGAVETARGSDVLPGKKRRDGRLVEGVGWVDAVPAQMARGIRARRQRLTHRQVHEFAVHCAGVATSDFLVEVVVAAHAAARRQRRRHVVGRGGLEDVEVHAIGVGVHQRGIGVLGSQGRHLLAQQRVVSARDVGELFQAAVIVVDFVGAAVQGEHGGDATQGRQTQNHDR